MAEIQKELAVAEAQAKIDNNAANEPELIISRCRRLKVSTIYTKKIFAMDQMLKLGLKRKHVL